MRSELKVFGDASWSTLFFRNRFTIYVDDLLYHQRVVSGRHAAKYGTEFGTVAASRRLSEKSGAIACRWLLSARIHPLSEERLL